MKRKALFSLFVCFLAILLPAQTLEQAKALYNKGEYEQAKPAFKKYLKSQPSNGNYNFWYGVCCVETGDISESIAPLELAVKKRVTSGRLYLGQAYIAAYRFEDAVNCLEEYIAELQKRKKSTLRAESLLEKAKTGLRMIKGTERVCVIDSIVVTKDLFLSAFKTGENCGDLFKCNDFFQEDDSLDTGIVFRSETGNTIWYAQRGSDSLYHIYTSYKQLDQWSEPKLLSGNVNKEGNANYPYILSDGTTLYFSSDCDGMGGYDIFVTRYNTSLGAYLAPQNLGMPFNSPYNDYMYVVDEYNNIGWFASDRFQPDDMVCVYIFIPNASKLTYDYENTDQSLLIRLAQIHSLRETWEDAAVVEQAMARYLALGNESKDTSTKSDFDFIIDDNTVYHFLSDFKSSQARTDFQTYLQKGESYSLQVQKLSGLRDLYAQSATSGKQELTPAILDLEQRIPTLFEQIQTLAQRIRKAEKSNL